MDMNECINTALRTGNKLLVLLLFSSLQVRFNMIFAIFREFYINLGKLWWNNIYLLVAIEDFNTKLENWYSQNNNNFEGMSVNI